MIKISVIRNNNDVDKILIRGHALYDDYGKDIVCASVSSIVITTVNAILRFDTESIFVDEDDFVIKVLKHNDIVDKLIINMICLLKELEHDYPDNIKFI